MIWQGCEKESPGSRLVSVTEISQGTRVPPRSTGVAGLEPKLPKVEESHGTALGFHHF